MVLAGIDQSLTGTGITIYNSDYHYYLLETRKENSNTPSIDYTRRLMSIRDDVRNILKHHNVQFVALEGISYGSKGRVVYELGGLSHLLRSMLIEENFDFVIVPPTILKKYWAGKGNANKQMMIDSAVNKKCNINITKNYGTKKEPYIQFDDNIVDSRALCDFLKENKIKEYENQIELSQK